MAKHSRKIRNEVENLGLNYKKSHVTNKDGELRPIIQDLSVLPKTVKDAATANNNKKPSKVTKKTSKKKVATRKKAKVAK